MYKVLIADPSPSELNTLSCMTNWDTCGLEITGLLSDSQQVIRFLEENPVDILIANVFFPQMDGIELLRRIQASQMDVLCIFMASGENIGYVQKAIPMGIENFLLKPVDPQILMETLSNTVQKLHRLQTQKPLAGMVASASESAVIRSNSLSLFNRTFEKLMLNQEYKQCIAYLDNLFSENSLSSGISHDFLRNHIVELAVYVINVLRSYNIDVNEIIDDDSTLFYNIISYTDMKDLYRWMKGFLTTSIEALETKNMRFSPCIARAVAHIEKNYAQDISLKTMAYDLNINAAYLGQLFKTETGQLFSAFLNKTRIENAKKMLLKTGLTLSEISQQCGYTNISYFYNIFKKYTGQTPSQYRKVKAQ